MQPDSFVLRLLILIQLISMAAMEMSGPFWPLRIQTLLGNEGVRYIGMLSAMLYAGPLLTAMAFTPLWGKLGDRVGHKSMIVRALLALALCQALAAIVTDVWLLIVIRAAQGGLAGFIAAAQAYAMTCCAEGSRGKTLAGLQSATAIGSLVGPIVGGWMIQTQGFAALCYSAATICLLCAMLSLFLTDKPIRARSAKVLVATPLPKSWLSALLAMIVLIQAAKVMPQPFYALYVSDILHGTPWLIGISYAASAATLAITAPLWGRLFDRRSPMQTLHVIEWVTWLCAATLAISTLATEWAGFIICRLLWGAWQGALLPVAYALIANTLPLEQQGFALGLGNSAAKAGALCGMVIGGVGISVVGLEHGFWLVAITYALAALGIRTLRLLLRTPAPASARPAFHPPEKIQP